MAGISNQNGKTGAASSMRKIYKYEVHDIGVPQDIPGYPAHFGFIDGKMYVWALQTGNDFMSTVCVFGTGWDIPDNYWFLGSIIVNHENFIGGPFVWHLMVEDKDGQ
jgi:hypothetical protein